MSDLKSLLKEVDETLEEGLLIVPEFIKDRVDKDVDTISTGLKELDQALDIGGLPRGRIVEITGEEGAAKSTLALSVIAQAQKHGLKAGYIDTEHALDRKRAGDIGVAFDEMAIAQPKDAEQALELLDMMVISKAFGVIVLDSVSALIPKAELEGEMSDANIGALARLMGKIMRKITGVASKGNTMVIFINQLRDKIGGFSPIPTKVGSGGNALKFYASVRLDLRRTKNEKKGETLLYTHHKCTIKKNKLGVPFKVVQFRVGKEGFLNEP